MNPDKKVRRVQSLLYTSGVGVILFSIWTGLRGIEGLFEVWSELRREYGTEMENAYKAACKKSSGDRFVYCSEKTDDALMTISLEIKKEFSEHSIVLIKASRGMGLERLTKFLCGAES